MNNTVKTIGVYILGAVSGGSIAAVICKKKYEKMYREQYEAAVKSVKETYSASSSKIEEDASSVEDIADKNPDNSLRRELAALTEKYRTGSDFEVANPLRVPEKQKPYILEPDQFGDEPDYEQISLVYYADGKLADEDDDLVENIPFILGSEWQERFDKYDEDVVYVRNDARRCDYEISRDYREYVNDILEDKPYLLHNVVDQIVTSMDEKE